MKNLLELPGKVGDEVIALRDGEDTVGYKNKYSKGDKFIIRNEHPEEPWLGFKDVSYWYNKEDFAVNQQEKIKGYLAPFDLFNGDAPKGSLFVLNGLNTSYVRSERGGCNVPREWVEKEWEAVYKPEFEEGEHVYVIREHGDETSGNLVGKVVKYLKPNYKGSDWDMGYVYIVEDENGDEDAVTEVRKATAEEIRAFEEIKSTEIAGYKPEFEDGVVKFGCQEFTKDQVQQVYDLLNRSGAAFQIMINETELPKRTVLAVLKKLNTQ